MTDLMRFVDGYSIMEAGLTFMRVVFALLMHSCNPAWL